MIHSECDEDSDCDPYSTCDNQKCKRMSMLEICEKCRSVENAECTVVGPDDEHQCTCKTGSYGDPLVKCEGKNIIHDIKID